MRIITSFLIALVCSLGASAQLAQWDFNKVSKDANVHTADDGTIVVDFQNPAVIQDYSGEYMINAQNSDWYATFDVYASTLVGTYTLSDFDTFYTNMMSWVTFDSYYPSAITFVCAVEDGKYQINIDMESDGQKFKIHMWAPAPPEGALDYDTQIGDVDYEYTSGEEIQIVDRHDMGENDVVIVFQAADGSNGAVFRMMLDADKVDPINIIPEGVYPINATGASGTFTASVGAVNGTVMPCYYAVLRSSRVTKPYFLTSGTVEVKHTKAGTAVIVDAKNSWNVPVKLKYAPEATGISDVNANNASADGLFFENGQVVVVKGNRKYNVSGAQMK